VRPRRDSGARRRSSADQLPTVGIGIIATVVIVAAVVLVVGFIVVLALGGR